MKTLVNKIIHDEENLVDKIRNDEDVRTTGFNFTAAYIIGSCVEVVSSALFGWNIDRYNSIAHFALGVGIGTLAYKKAYRKTGKRAVGVVSGLFAATVFNFVWEGFEMIRYNNPITSIDTLSDIAVVYAGAALSFGEKKVERILGK